MIVWPRLVAPWIDRGLYDVEVPQRHGAAHVAHADLDDGLGRPQPHETRETELEVSVPATMVGNMWCCWY